MTGNSSGKIGTFFSCTFLLKSNVQHYKLLFFSLLVISDSYPDCSPFFFYVPAWLLYTAISHSTICSCSFCQFHSGNNKCFCRLHSSHFSISLPSLWIVFIFWLATIQNALHYCTIHRTLISNTHLHIHKPVPYWYNPYSHRIRNNTGFSST